MKQVPYCGATNIRSQETKFSHFGNMAPRICASLYGDMIPCILVDRYCCYGGTCCLHIWVRRHEFNRENWHHI